MRNLRNVVLGALVATLAIVALGSSASARRLEFSSQSFRVAFPIAGEPPRPELISCPFTLEGSFHSRTISKTSALIGYVTRAIVAEASCRNGKGRFLTETLPWHVRYEAFSGALPNITAIRGQVIGLSVRYEFERLFGLLCLYVTEVGHPAKFILNRTVETGVISSFRLDESAMIPSRTEGFCFETFLSGTEQFTVQNSSTRITVRLVQ
jgi:hypothetical protein